MQAKTTRAFRTISEAAEELDLQPHVLRFWESKFPSFNPIKRGGGRRFYRPEDIEFLRGIKILLHDERHPIKDVQKLIRVKGVNRVVELGRSIQQAAVPKDVKDTVLVPERIQASENEASIDHPLGDTESTIAEEFSDENFAPPEEQVAVETEVEDVAIEVATPIEEPEYVEAVSDQRVASKIFSIEEEPSGLSVAEREDLERALTRLLELRDQWQSFKRADSSQ